jgi:AraC family transcriptional regulator
MAKGRLGKAIEFMEANLDRSIGLPAISDAAGLSPSHFARQFRASVGQAPHQYLMQGRVEHAKRRLGETNAGLAEIADACGFTNQEHLTRLFKRACGTTPAAYRKTRRD